VPRSTVKSQRLMGYSLVDFAKSLNVDNCKIWNTPRLIFLCGGKTGKTGGYRSARDFFYRHLLSKNAPIARRVRLAEDVNAWFRKDVFPDLLELENYLAGLADITVLFVESPGSIAELGAFAASDALRPKMLAVLNTFHDSEKTFISDGPVQKIKNEDKQLVHYYRWNPKQLSSSATEKEFRDMAKDLTAFLVERDKSHPNKQSFDKEKPGHVLLLVADLIGIPGVATSTEVTDCLKELGCKADHETRDRYLSLLESMSFIQRARRSNQEFYISVPSKHFIQYAYQTGALNDSKRIKTGMREALEPIRKKILTPFLHQPPKKGTPNV